MAKIILLAIGAWLVVLLLKRYRRSLDDAPRPQHSRLADDMVRCDKCGMYLPRTESVLKRGAYYCCEEHSRPESS